MRTFRVPGIGALLCYDDLPGDEPSIVFLHGLGAASSEEFTQTVHVVGHSMGGSVAIALAMRNAQLVRSLVVAEGNLDPGVGTLSARIAAWSEEDYIREGHLTIARELQSSFADVPAYGGFVRTVALTSPHAMHRSARSLLAERTPTFRQGLEDLPLPRTFLVGDRSLPGYPEAGWPRNGVNVVVVPEAGHVMNVDNPDGFARAIADALARAETGAGVRS